MLHAFESEQFGDLADRQGGFQKQMHNLVGSGPSNFSQNGAAHEAAKPPLQSAAGEARFPGYLADRQRPAGVVTNKPQNLGETRIARGHNIGGTPGHDMAGQSVNSGRHPDRLRHQQIERRSSTAVALIFGEGQPIPARMQHNAGRRLIYERQYRPAVV